MALKDNSISILEYHIQDDRMIIDILEQSKKRIYDHYLDYVSSSKSTVFEEDKQKIVDLFTQKINGPIIYREYYRGSQEYCVKTLQQSSIIRMMKQKSYLQQLLILLLIGMNKTL